MQLFSARDLATTVCRHWQATLPSGFVTAWPGTEVGTATLSEWFELWVDAWQPRPQRAISPARWDVAVTVHCYVRPQLDAGRVQELAELARAALANRLLSVRTTNAGPLLGHLQLLEPELVDLSRKELERRKSALRHAMLRGRGVAQQSNDE